MGLISRVSSRTYRSNGEHSNMIIPTDERIKIYKNLFSEGVMIAAKNTRTAHKETNIKNLYVMNALKSRGYVKENYVWQHYHWTLTDEGLTYLRETLHLPENVMPNTLKRTQEPQAQAQRPRNKVTEGRPVYDREAYRRDDKAGEAGAGGQPVVYKGGYGRGKPAAQ